MKGVLCLFADSPVMTLILSFSSDEAMPWESNPHSYVSGLSPRAE